MTIAIRSLASVLLVASIALPLTPCAAQPNHQEVAVGLASDGYSVNGRILSDGGRLFVLKLPSGFMFTKRDSLQNTGWSEFVQAEPGTRLTLAADDAGGVWFLIWNFAAEFQGGGVEVSPYLLGRFDDEGQLTVDRTLRVAMPFDELDMTANPSIRYVSAQAYGDGLLLLLDLQNSFGPPTGCLVHCGPSGDVLWGRWMGTQLNAAGLPSWGDGFDPSDNPLQLSILDGGPCVALARGWPALGESDFRVVSFSPGGTLQWAKRYSYLADSWCTLVGSITHDGSVTVGASLFLWQLSQPALWGTRIGPDGELLGSYIFNYGGDIREMKKGPSSVLWSYGTWGQGFYSTLEIDTVGNLVHGLNYTTQTFDNQAYRFGPSSVESRNGRWFAAGETHIQDVVFGTQQVRPGMWNFDAGTDPGCLASATSVQVQSVPESVLQVEAFDGILLTNADITSEIGPLEVASMDALEWTHMCDLLTGFGDTGRLSQVPAILPNLVRAGEGLSVVGPRSGDLVLIDRHGSEVLHLPVTIGSDRVSVSTEGLVPGCYHVMEVGPARLWKGVGTFMVVP